MTALAKRRRVAPLFDVDPSRDFAGLASLGYRVTTVSELLATKHAIAEPSLYHRVE